MPVVRKIGTVVIKIFKHAIIDYLTELVKKQINDYSKKMKTEHCQKEVKV